MVNKYKTAVSWRDYEDLRNVTIDPVMNGFAWLLSLLVRAAAIRGIYVNPGENGSYVPPGQLSRDELKQKLKEYVTVGAHSHTAYLDFVLEKLEKSSLGLPEYYTAAAEALIGNGLGTIFRSTGAFPINRDFKGESKEEYDAYGRSRCSFFADKVREGGHVMWYPSSQRSRTGFVSDSRGIFGGPYINLIIDLHKEMEGKGGRPLGVLVGSTTYDWLPELREFHFEDVSEEKQKHYEMIRTIFGLTAGWDGFFNFDFHELNTRLNNIIKIKSSTLESEIEKVNVSSTSKIISSLLISPSFYKVGYELLRASSKSTTRSIYHNSRAFFDYLNRVLRPDQAPYGNAYLSYSFIDLDDLFAEKGRTRKVLADAILTEMENGLIVNPTMMVSKAFQPNGNGYLPDKLKMDGDRLKIDEDGHQKIKRKKLEEIIGIYKEKLIAEGIPVAPAIRKDSSGNIIDHAMHYLVREGVVEEVKGIAEEVGGKPEKWYVEIRPSACRYFANLASPQFNRAFSLDNL